MNIGKEIKAAREGKGIRVRELSEMTGVDYSYISKIENGISVPTVKMAEKILKPMGLKLKVERDD